MATVDILDNPCQLSPCKIRWIAVVLIEAAESLSRTAKYLAGTRPTGWMPAEQAAAYLGFKPMQAFERVVALEGVPKQYLSARAPRYNRAELDAWLMSR